MPANPADPVFTSAGDGAVSVKMMASHFSRAPAALPDAAALEVMSGCSFALWQSGTAVPASWLGVTAGEACGDSARSRELLRRRHGIAQWCVTEDCAYARRAEHKAGLHIHGLSHQMASVLCLSSHARYPNEV